MYYQLRHAWIRTVAWCGRLVNNTDFGGTSAFGVFVLARGRRLKELSKKRGQPLVYSAVWLSSPFLWFCVSLLLRSFSLLLLFRSIEAEQREVDGLLSPRAYVAHSKQHTADPFFFSSNATTRFCASGSGGPIASNPTWYIGLGCSFQLPFYGHPKVTLGTQFLFFFSFF